MCRYGTFVHLRMSPWHRPKGRSFWSLLGPGISLTKSRDSMGKRNLMIHHEIELIQPIDSIDDTGLPSSSALPLLTRGPERMSGSMTVPFFEDF